MSTSEITSQRGRDLLKEIQDEIRSVAKDSADSFGNRKYALPASLDAKVNQLKENLKLGVRNNSLRNCIAAHKQ